jgi:REP element-mobilizing transposase RayT
MPRKPRVFIDGGIYHVYCRVSRGEAVFADRNEAEAFLDIIQKIKARDGLVVFAWALMSNHYHLALRTAEVPLWRSMASIQGLTTKGFNRRHRVYGPLWQGRYNATVVDDERYLYQLVAYVHLNPVSAGFVDDPAKYEWSGHCEILGKGGSGIVDCDEVLMMYGDSRRAARRAYVRSLNTTGATVWAGEEPGMLRWCPGVEEEPVSPGEGGVYVDYLGRSTAPERPRLTVDEYLDRASSVLDVSVQELASRRREPRLRELRELVAVLGVERYGQRVRDIAGVLKKNPGSVSRWVTNAAERRSDDPSFAERLGELDEALPGAGPARKPETL